MKKRRKKSLKIFTVLLAMATVIAFTPAMAFAGTTGTSGTAKVAKTLSTATTMSDATEFPTWTTAGTDKVQVGDTVFDVTTATKSNEAGTWTWTAKSGYDKTKAVSDTNNVGTLTLKGFKLSYEKATYAISLPAGVVVNVIGTNKITNTGAGNITAAIVANGDVMFIGTGNLSATDEQTEASTKSLYTSGIFGYGAMTFSGPDVTGTGGIVAALTTSNVDPVPVSHGIHAKGDVTVTAGIITCVGGSAQATKYAVLSEGLCTDGNFAVSGSASVYASTLSLKGKGDIGSACGCSVSGTSTISGKSTLNFTAGEADSESVGFFSASPVTVSDDATVGAIGSDSNTSSVGAGVNALIMKGGTFSAMSGDAAAATVGLITVEEMTITGGTVSAFAGDITTGVADKNGTLKATNVGIMSYGTISISGGHVLSEAGANKIQSDYDIGIGASKSINITGGITYAICDKDCSAITAPSVTVGSDLTANAAKPKSEYYDAPATLATNSNGKMYFTYSDGTTAVTAYAVKVAVKPLSVGSTLTNGKLAFKVTSNKILSFYGGYITLTGFKKGQSASTVTIPDEFVVGEFIYYNSSIAANAFKGKTVIKKVTIPYSITKIGSKAFYGDKNLKTIVVKSSYIKSVGSMAFKGINKNAKINVPNSKIKAYKKLFLKAGMPNTVKIY